MQAEGVTLRKVLDHKIALYKHKHDKEMSTTAVSQMLSNTLYQKRFFPYYAFVVVGGIDDEGKGCVFGYDSVGSFERMQYCVTGSATKLMTSVLDNQVGHKMREDSKLELTLQQTIDLVKDCYTVATERDIYTVSYCMLFCSALIESLTCVFVYANQQQGDSVDLWIVTAAGCKHENFALKQD
jgi:20S proteasome subunit beta 6